MAQVINTNLASINTQRHLNASLNDLRTSIERLSSGKRVNSAKDDAAGLAVATRMDSLVRGMAVAQRNASDGISMYQTAESAVGKISDAMSRMRELSIQAANGTLNSNVRENIALEFTLLHKEVTRIVSGTTFNGLALLDSAGALNTFVGTTTFQIGAEASGANVITVSGKVDVNWTGILDIADTAILDIGSATVAASSLKFLDSGLQITAGTRAKYGALQNRFETIISQLQVASENQTSARSRIMDTDFATETAALTRGQILQQAGTAMLAQANNLPQNVLSLLRG